MKQSAASFAFRHASTSSACICCVQLHAVHSAHSFSTDFAEIIERGKPGLNAVPLALELNDAPLHHMTMNEK